MVLFKDFYKATKNFMKLVNDPDKGRGEVFNMYRDIAILYENSNRSYSEAQGLEAALIMSIMKNKMESRIYPSRRVNNA